MADDFRELFQREAGVQLTRLGESILRLESGGDPELVQDMFRDVHSIKGASAMVGFADVSRVAHAFEDILDQLRAGLRSPDPELIDLLLKTVDGLRELIDVLVAGDDGAAKADAVESALHNLADPAAVSVPVAGPAPAAAPRPVPAASETIPVPVEGLDELVRLVNESSAALLRVGRFIEETIGTEDARSVAEFRELTRVLGTLQERTMRARMVSVGTIAAPLRRAVRDAARQTGKQARLELAGEQTQLDRHVLETLRDPLMHLVRNSVDHGLEAPERRVARGKQPEGVVHLSAKQVGSDVELTVADDGAGIDLGALRADAGDPSLSDEEAINRMFRPGVSTAGAVTGLSGRGVGLDVVRGALASVRGRIDVRTAAGTGTEFVIRAPITLAALHSLLVSAGDGRFAIPLRSVVTVLQPNANAPTVALGEQAIPVGSLAETLGFARNGDGAGPVVVLDGDGDLHAFRVGRLMGQRPVVVKELGDIVPRLELVAGASIEPDGSVMLVLDAPALVKRANVASGSPAVRRPAAPAHARARVLVVDDAAAVRELERSILEKAGYEVIVAADGREALLRIADRAPDMVVTDIEMPELDGIALIETIRSTPRIERLPVLIVSTLAEEPDRLRGLESGADAYLSKADFDEAGLLKAVERLLRPG